MNKIETDEWKERYIERYAERDRICKKCGHPEGMHYWNGSGNDMYAGFNTCLVDGCHCVYDEKNMEEVVIKESVEDEIGFISQLLFEKYEQGRASLFREIKMEALRAGDLYKWVENKQLEISESLEDENEHIKTHKKFLKLAEKQEGWKEELRFTYGHLYYQNEEGEFCQIVNEIDDLIDFISKLLKEKTFSKEELNRLSIWSGDVGSFGVVSDEDAELINKIYKLLDGEKENE